jgi:hypothetical protein
MNRIICSLCALVAFALPSEAYVLNVNGGGYARHWELRNPPNFVPVNSVNRTNHAIRYYLGSDGYSVTNTAAELNAIRNCVDQWLAVSNTIIKFEEAGLLDPPVDVNTGDATNIFYWAKNSTIVNGGLDNISGFSGVTFSSFTVDDNTFFEADIAFNGVQKTWFTDFNDTAATSTFVEGIALHELGHFLGLAHSPVGAATMFSRGPNGVNAQAGLDSDDIAAIRSLYPVTTTGYAALQGTVTKFGSPVFGAQIIVQNSATNVVAGTVTLSDGQYRIYMLPPGAYTVRTTPLDPQVSPRLIAGIDISSDFTGADTSFLPSADSPVTLLANQTNTLDFDTVASAPAFRIAFVRVPTTDFGTINVNTSPQIMTVGQSNYYIGVASGSLPTSNASFSVSGDGLTVGAPTFFSSGGLNYVSAPISISSNATPGLRSYRLSQSGNVAYANGILEIKSPVPDYNFDGLDDRFQRQFFPTFTSLAAAPGSDPDIDGLNNYAEYIAGTVPTNAASALHMLSVARTNTTATIRWESVNAKKYQVSFRTNIVAGSWSNIGSLVTATSSVSLYTDTTATQATRFYRVQVIP